MQITYDHFPPYTEKCIFTHDARICRIVCNTNFVEFYFSNGFYYVKDNHTYYTQDSRIILHDYDLSDFFCHLVHRRATEGGVVENAVPMTLCEINDILVHQSMEIELSLELFDADCLYWRGYLLPCRKTGLSDMIVIEFHKASPITYLWDDELTMRYP